MYQHSPDHNAVFKGRFNASWSLRLGGKVNGGLALVNGTLYAVSFDKKLYAIDAETGHILWSTGLGRIVMSTPVISGGMIVVGTGTNNVLRDQGADTVWGSPSGDEVLGLASSTGVPIWAFHTVGEDMPTPAIFGQAVIFANGDDHAYSLDLVTGKQLWSAPLPGVSTMASVNLVGRSAYVVASHGLDYAFRSDQTHIFSIDGKTGGIRWSAPYGNADCAITVGGSVGFVEGTAYTRYSPNDAWGWAGRNVITAFDLKSGRQLWSSTSCPGYFTSVASNERAIAGTISNGVYYQSIPVQDTINAFDATSGRMLWSAHTAGAVKMSPVDASGYLVFGDTAGLLYVLNDRTGDTVSVLSYKAPFGTSPPIILGSTIFIANGASILAIPITKLIGVGPVMRPVISAGLG